MNSKKEKKNKKELRKEQKKNKKKELDLNKQKSRNTFPFLKSRERLDEQSKQATSALNIDQGYGSLIYEPH